MNQLQAAHRRLKAAQTAMALFTVRTKGRDLTEQESAEQSKLRQEERDAIDNLFRVEHRVP